MESLTAFEAAFYIAGFIAAFMAGRIVPDLITDGMRWWRHLAARPKRED
jgi:hypothetical protein